MTLLARDALDRICGEVLEEAGIDVRADLDHARRSQFTIGWRDAVERGRQYDATTLARITWRNLGYRFGRRPEVAAALEPHAVIGHLSSEFGATSGRRVWKLMCHHEEARQSEAAEWFVRHSVIGVGWGRLGDLGAPSIRGPRSISDRIRHEYPGLRNAGQGGAALWRFFYRVRRGDLVILTASGRRVAVVEIVGDYEWTPETGPLGDYQHVRKAAVRRDLDPDVVWDRVGRGVARGESVRWVLALCTISAIGDTPTRDPLRFFEGSKYEVIATRPERDPAARARCLEVHGLQCRACGFDFEARYGDIGRGFIHVHHVEPLAGAHSERETDPERDLVPLCPNCHAMVHRVLPPLTVDDLRERVRTAATQPSSPADPESSRNPVT